MSNVLSPKDLSRVERSCARLVRRLEVLINNSLELRAKRIQELELKRRVYCREHGLIEFL